MNHAEIDDRLMVGYGIDTRCTSIRLPLPRFDKYEVPGAIDDDKYDVVVNDEIVKENELLEVNSLIETGGGYIILNSDSKAVGTIESDKYNIQESYIIDEDVLNSEDSQDEESCDKSSDNSIDKDDKANKYRTLVYSSSEDESDFSVLYRMFKKGLCGCPLSMYGECNMKEEKYEQTELMSDHDNPDLDSLGESIFTNSKHSVSSSSNTHHSVDEESDPIFSYTKSHNTIYNYSKSEPVNSTINHSTKLMSPPSDVMSTNSEFRNSIVSPTPSIKLMSPPSEVLSTNSEFRNSIVSPASSEKLTSPPSYVMSTNSDFRNSIVSPASSIKLMSAPSEVLSTNSDFRNSIVSPASSEKLMSPPSYVMSTNSDFNNSIIASSVSAPSNTMFTFSQKENPHIYTLPVSSFNVNNGLSPLSSMRSVERQDNHVDENTIFENLNSISVGSSEEDLANTFTKSNALSQNLKEFLARNREKNIYDDEISNVKFVSTASSPTCVADAIAEIPNPYNGNYNYENHNDEHHNTENHNNKNAQNINESFESDKISLLGKKTYLTFRIFSSIKRKPLKHGSFSHTYPLSWLKSVRKKRLS